MFILQVISFLPAFIAASSLFLHFVSIVG